MQYAKLWVGLAVVIVTFFEILGYFGREVYRRGQPGQEADLTTAS